MAARAPEDLDRLLLTLDHYPITLPHRKLAADGIELAADEIVDDRRGDLVRRAEVQGLKDVRGVFPHRIEIDENGDSDQDGDVGNAQDQVRSYH